MFTVSLCFKNNYVTVIYLSRSFFLRLDNAAMATTRHVTGCVQMSRCKHEHVKLGYQMLHNFISNIGSLADQSFRNATQSYHFVELINCCQKYV